jgi:hypothetical protein
MSYLVEHGAYTTHRRFYRPSKQRYFGQWDRIYNSEFHPTAPISHQNNSVFEQTVTHPMCTGQTDDGSFEIARAFYGPNQGLFTFFPRRRNDKLRGVLGFGRASPLHEGALGWGWGCTSFRHGVSRSVGLSGCRARREWCGCNFPREALHEKARLFFGLGL